ncbi:hypothetical protein SPAB_03576 [Salmonella enterica subsp. enterica serovar Paratyphi B str. SPB7]|uniref:Uncharacterized protein n=1 Tax=Salmonella paratyphi B (strain ATCC BAA-1250 / SPB7) TaxID=1016998 RepID=A0A6C6Z5X0_SALPB|nr:hypothetical protein SPAB_03576 [Salmonella enterica subsp. enterica serovar Paratyphi B str. SPB7]
MALGLLSSSLLMFPYILLAMSVVLDSSRLPHRTQGFLMKIE